MQGLEEWQQLLAKILFDQTALSLGWNWLYFGLLGAMRLDPPGAVLGQLWASGFSLMKAGWRLWPLAHVVTYGLMPPEHRHVLLRFCTLTRDFDCVKCTRRSRCQYCLVEGVSSRKISTASDSEDQLGMP